MIGEFILLMISITVLIETSHMVIDSSVRISHLTRIGEFVIGFIFISLTTSIPEFAVSFSAVSMGDIGISIGNLFGSNITDIALIIGIIAIMGAVKIKRGNIQRLATILLFTSLIPISLLIVGFASKAVGAILIISFIFFIYFIMKRKIKIEKRIKRPPKYRRYRNLLPLIVLFLTGIIGVLVSSRIVVKSATSVAGLLGITGSVIGATIIALGTSLPELAIGIESIRKGRFHLALGETLGSTLVNISLILGFVLLTSPFVINLSIFTTILMFVLLTNIVLLHFITVKGRGVLDRKEGLVLLLIYIMFIISIYTTQIIII